MITIETLRFWCQKVIPLVYDDSLSYYELLSKILHKTNEIITTSNGHSDAINNLNLDVSILEDKVEGLINNLVDVISPWDSSLAYHIFSIVEYQGTNYIAIKDVPVGAMITNTEYWQPANTALEQINAIGATVSSMTREYDTAEDMIDDATLSVNQIAITKGFHSVNDGGSALYVMSNEEPDGYANIATASN